MHAEYIMHPCTWKDKQGYFIAPPVTAQEYLANGGSDTYSTYFPYDGEEINNGCCNPVSTWLQGGGNDWLMTTNPDIVCNSEYITSEDKFAESSFNTLVWVGIVGLLLTVAVTS